MSGVGGPVPVVTAPSAGAPVLLVAILNALVAACWFLTQLSQSWSPPVVGWVFPIVGCGCAALACRRAGRTEGMNPDARRFWTSFAFSMVAIGFGVVSEARDTLVDDRTAAESASPPTLAIYSIGVLSSFLAVLRLPGLGARARLDPRRFRIDLVIVVITVTVFLWHLVLREIWSSLVIDSPAGVAVIGFGGTVAVMVLTKVVLTGSGPIDLGALRTLALSVAIGVVGGAFAPALEDRHDVFVAQLALPLTGAVMALAAARQRRAVLRPRTARPARRRSFSLLPYLSVAATDGLLLVTARHDVETQVVALAVVALTMVVVARQILALRENEKLLGRLDANMVELHEAKDELAHQATHDAVTGLANRLLFEQRVREALQSPGVVSLALVDLDDFKIINDRFGHQAGDEVLIQVADRLRSCTREGDTVARLGGDEFAVLLCGVDTGRAREILERISNVVQQPIAFGAEMLLVGVSIGMAHKWPGVKAVELLRRADMAMYAAKESGKGRLSEYDAEMELQAADRTRIAADLRSALRRGEFRIVFQPDVRLPDGEIHGAEALVRWWSPERGPISPADFIPIAESTGLIIPLGAWILRETCRQAAAWLDIPAVAARDWRIGVNISARQLREPGFARQVSDVLEETRLPAERLTVEVTETAVFDNTSAVRELEAISQLGVLIALDDFGTGHSSLGLLENVPADVLKLDKSFVDRITAPGGNTVIAGAMIQIAEGLRMQAIAEGVETEQQATLLHELGYRFAQGYYFARPLPPEEFLELLTAGSVTPVAH